MKKNKFDLIKNIILIFVLLIIYIYIGINIGKYIVLAAGEETDITLYNFGRLSDSELFGFESAAKVELKYKFITGDAGDDFLRQASSRNYCIQFSSYGANSEDRTYEGVYKLTEIVDINGKIATSPEKSGEYNSYLNSMLAYISYYAKHIDQSGSEYYMDNDLWLGTGHTSDTLYAFRNFYKNTDWRKELYSNLGITTYKHKNNVSITAGGAIYTNAEKYGEFLELNSSAGKVLKIEKVGTSTEPSIDSTYIGPFMVNYPEEGEEGHISNKTECKYINQSNSEISYSGNYYTNTGGTYTSIGNKVPRNQEFYIKVTDSDVKKVKFKNSYYVYIARIFVFDGGWEQANITVAGYRDTEISEVEYEIQTDPNVTITKQVGHYKENLEDVVYRNSIDAEPGDLVVFKVTVNNIGAATKLKMSDNIPDGFTIVGVQRTEDGNRKDYEGLGITEWPGLDEKDIAAKNGRFARYFICRVEQTTPGTITNTATINPYSSSYKLNSSNSPSLSASASVNVLGYDYELTKTVDKTQVEPGESLKYTITLENKNDTCLHNVKIEDNVPVNLEISSYNYDTSVWKRTTTGNKVKFELKAGKAIAKEPFTFEINCKVKNTEFYTTNQTGINNKAEITNITNRNDKPLEKKEDDVNISILGYNYNITKSISKIITTREGELTETSDCQYGDIIVYAITVNNSGSGGIKTLTIEDALPTTYLDSFALYGTNNGWSLSGTTLTYTGPGNEYITSSGSTTVYVQARVKSKSTTEATITNSVSITGAGNRFEASILLSGKTSSVDATLKTYSVSLYKYLEEGRKTKNNKYEDPVIVEQGDEITYTIEIKNEGPTNLYNISIEDILPAGIEAKDASYNGYMTVASLAAGGTAIVTLDVRVTMSNIYLPNIENIATLHVVNNRNNLDIVDVLNYQTTNNTDYIRLDELDISGVVFNDGDANGEINQSAIDNGTAAGVEGVKVILHDMDNHTSGSCNGNCAFEITGGGTGLDKGKYSFSNVIKGKGFTQTEGTTGYYSENIHKQYYLEYIYDGILYQSTEYSGRSNLDENAGIRTDRKYERDSNAADKPSVRQAFNEALSTITYNKSVKPDGTLGYELEYDKNETTSTLIKDNSENWWKMSAYSFINTSEVPEYLWLSKNKLNPPTSVENPKTEYLNYINLGLRKKEVDLELESELVSFTKTINGQRLDYLANSKGNDKVYEHQLYATDYYYRYDQAYAGETNEMEAIRNIKGVESELNLEVLFKTTLKNSSDSEVDAVINEVVQYYDSNFLDFNQNRNMRIDSNNDGEFEASDEQYSFQVKGIYHKEDGTTVQVKGIGNVNKTAAYELAESNPSGYKKVFISNITDLSNNIIKLKPGEYIELETNYLVDKDSDRNLKILENTGIISEILAYTTYYNDVYAGSIDKDSNPGNIGIDNNGNKVSIENTTYYEDETGKSEINFYIDEPDEPDTPDTPGNPKERELTGNVWEDKLVGTSSGIGDGEFVSPAEKGIKDIQVELIEVVKYETSGITKYAEISTGKFYTNSNGQYTVNSYKPGCYIVRFTYGNDSTKENNMIYNGQDYKSTTYKAGVENIFNNTTNNNLKTLAENSNKSDARDDEQRRLETMDYSLEMYNQKAEVLKYDGLADKETVDLEQLYMFADTVNFIARVEYVENDIVEIKDNGGSWETYKEDGSTGAFYNGNYYIENIDFGLIKRPINEIELKKYIKEIIVKTSSEEILVKLIYDENGNLDEGNSKGFENVQAINNTPTEQGFRYINIDEEILQGAGINITYGFKVINNSEVDYINKNLYGSQTDIEKLTTVEVLEKMKEARDFYTTGAYNYKDELYRGVYEYGKYIGKVHYTGTVNSDDVIATLKIDTILDYADNGLVFGLVEGSKNGNWVTKLEKELILGGYLDPNVATYINPSEDDEDEKIKTYEELEGLGYNYFKDETSGKYGFTTISGVEFEGNIADINQVGFQIESKNNLIVTIDDSVQNGELSKQLYSSKSYNDDRSRANTELTLSRFLSTESSSDDMEYTNVAEIIKFTTLTGRRTISEQTVGNAKINLVGYRNSDVTLGELDTSIPEKVTLTPPTGEDWIKLNTVIKIIIYLLLSSIVIGLFVVLIPKLVSKIKNRKFIK